METGALGRIYEDGEIIVRQGDVGECMFVIQEGEVDILCDENGEEIHIATRHAGDFIGEMAIFDRDVRSATIRAKGEVRILTVDKKNFMSRIHEDPSLAFRIVETMSHRLRELQAEYTKLREHK
jgi:CRP/FNR family cyclic AMP-dependent transcriptional regulator